MSTHNGLIHYIPCNRLHLLKAVLMSGYTTGSVKFDTFLNVGFETQAITEIAGEYGSTPSPHFSSSKKLQVFVEGTNSASYHESQTSIGRKA